MSTSIKIVLNDDNTTSLIWSDSDKENTITLIDPYQVVAIDAMVAGINTAIQRFQWLDAQLRMQKFLEENPDLKASMEEIQQSVYPKPKAAQTVETVEPNTAGYL